MYKFLPWAVALLVSTAASSQQTDINYVLEQVEQNNRELIALRSYVEGQKQEIQSSNNLPDPQVGAYYLPFGEHATGDYSEFEISQSFEFPTVYSSRKRLMEARKSSLEVEFENSRQAILLKAQKLCFDIIYLNKRLKIEEGRLEQARTVYEQIKQLFDDEEIGILELNKAKIAWLQDQFVLQQLESEKTNALVALQTLNGNQQTSFDLQEYPNDDVLDDFESLWNEKQTIDPELKKLKQEEDIAVKRLQLAKNKSLPNLTAGYNYQGVSSSNYSGIYAGITIPLWSNRNKVSAAKSQLNYREIYSDALINNLKSDLRQLFTNYQTLKSKYTEYKSSVEQMNSQELLYQTYESGEISFISYYMELQFFRNAIDKKMEMEKELNRLKAELLKHNL